MISKNENNKNTVSNPVRVILILISFVILGFIVYHNALFVYFLSDDLAIIGALHTGGLEKLLEVFTHFLRPVLFFSFWIELQLWQLNPVSFHATNIFLHCINAFWVFLLTSLFFRMFSITSRPVFPAYLAGLFFLVLPSHSEAVTWISGRSDVLATFFMLPSLITYCLYLSRQKNIYLILSVLSFLLAVYTKESALAVPLVVAFISVLFYTQNRFTVSLTKLTGIICIYIACAVVYFISRYIMLGRLIGGYGDVHTRFALDSFFSWFYEFSIRSLLPPLPESFAHFLLNNQIITSIFIAGILALLFFKFSHNRGATSFFVLVTGCFIMSALPAHHLGVSLTNTFGERFVYFPSVFSCIGIAGVIFYLVNTRRIIFISTIIIAVFYSIALYRVNNNWVMAGTIVEHSVRKMTDESQTNIILVLNIPDNYNGAYVFRHGVAMAVKVFMSAPEKIVITLGRHGLLSLNDKVILNRDPSHNNIFSVSLENEQTRFFQIAGASIVAIESQSDRQFSFRFTETPPMDVYSYSDGKIQKQNNLLSIID